MFPLNKIVRSDSEKNLNDIERIKCAEIMLRYDFPMKFYVFNSVFNILFGLAAIGFQIGSIIVQSPLYYIGTGYFLTLYSYNKNLHILIHI
jgi:hypothetical protein